MNNNEIAFESLKASIRPHLRQYLEQENVKISSTGMLRCLNPQHADKNASMKLLTDLREEQVWCYGCHASGDIFTVNNWIKKSPLTGLEFIKENVFGLAKTFGIPHDDIELSPEQIERLELFSLNALACERLVAEDENKLPINWTAEYCEKRGWNKNTCKKLKIATILDFTKFAKDLQQATGMTLGDLESKGITSNLFGPDLITIPIMDERNRVAGFTARKINWIKGSEGPKYRNSSHSPAFQKGKILYGMNFIKTSAKRRLDVFEGNGSFITAFGAGHNSCVALCGSSISEDQIDLILNMGFTHINLVLDNDDTGKQKTDEYMQKLSGIEGLRVECTKLTFKEEDKDLKDPDDFIRRYSLGAFFKLKPTSAFDWYLEKEAELVKSGQVSPTEFANKMVKVIYNTDNRIDRSRQRAKLSEITGIPERDLEAEMERQVRVSVSELKTIASKKLSGAKSVDEILQAFEGIKSSAGDSLEYKEINRAISIDESLKSFEDFMTILETKKAGIQGWITGYPLVDSKVSGIPKPIGLDPLGEIIPIPGSIIGFAGAPQHGKSTIMQNFVLNIVTKNPDVICLNWCLDDSRQRVTERLLAMHSGVSWKKITRRVPADKEELERIRASAETLRGLINEGRFIMKDHSNGSTLQFLFKWVESIQEQTKTPILVVIDSFHKINSAESDGNANEYAKVKRFCEKLKSFVQTHCVTVMASLELSKGQSRGVEPDMLNIMDARKIEYDFDTIATVYNHFFDTDGESEQVVRLPNGLVRPIIKLNFRKSKDGGSGPVFFAQDQENFRIKDYSIDDIRRLTGLTQITPIEGSGFTLSMPDKGQLMQTSNKEPWAS